MNFPLFFLSLIILYIKKTYSKSILSEQLTCGQDKDGSDIFKSVDGQHSCTVCLCADLNKGISYKNCEKCCCAYVRKTKIKDYEHFEEKSIKDERELFKTKNDLYGLIALNCFFFLTSLVSTCLYLKKRFRRTRLSLQSTEKDEFMNGDVKVIINHEKIQNTD
nr:uncharacterized protein LOC105844361 [Hydra vulgaris]